MSLIQQTYVEIYYDESNNDPYYNPYINPSYDPSYNLNTSDQLLYYKWSPYFYENFKKPDFDWNILPKRFVSIIRGKYKQYLSLCYKNSI